IKNLSETMINLSTVSTEPVPAKPEENSKEKTTENNDKKTTSENSDKKTTTKDGKTNTEKEKKPEPEPIKITEKELVKVSEDGMNLYFFENFDMKNHRGDLYHIVGGKKGNRTKIASNVFYNISLSKNGQAVLYLENASENGDNGQLSCWNATTKACEVLDKNVVEGNFGFSQDGNSVLFINAYNSEYHVGNLNVRSFAKGETASRQLDSDVAATFGTNPTGNIKVYAKNYNKDDETFDLYRIKDGEAPTQIGTKAKLPPVFLEKSDKLYAYDSFDKDSHKVVSINLDNNDKKEIGTEITNIIGVSKDELSIVFSKEYDNKGTQIIDYYYVSSDAVAPQKIANNVGVFEDDQHSRIVQFAINEDFTRVAYISGFNAEKERGSLYTESIQNGYVGTEKRISDDAYSCNVSTDGTVVRFATNYNKDTNTVAISSFFNGNTAKLAEGVGSSSFTFDKNADSTVYARNYDAQKKSGKLECVDRNGKVKDIVSEVNAYGLKDTGKTIFFTNLNQENGRFNLHIVDAKGEKQTEIDTDVTKVLVY
ncbi:MAG: hypothetical protein RSA27_06995, partial [Oscillospiraceae bacterium]